INVYVDPDDVNPRLPSNQRRTHLVSDATRRVSVDGGENVIVDGATVFGPHRSLARRRANNEADALLDLAIVRDDSDGTSGIGADGERQSGADEFFAHVSLLIRAMPAFPESSKNTNLCPLRETNPVRLTFPRLNRPSP